MNNNPTKEYYTKKNVMPFRAPSSMCIERWAVATWKLAQRYRPDLICFGKIIVELKAVKEIGKEHKAQVFNYLINHERHEKHER